MAHILVIEAEDAIRDVLRVALRDEGHVVLTPSDATIALAALRLTTSPLVVLLSEHIYPLSGLDVLAMAAEDTTGRLARHGFVLMTTDVDRVSARLRALLQGMVVPLLALPFDLDDLSAVVKRADCQLRARPVA